MIEATTSAAICPLTPLKFRKPSNFMIRRLPAAYSYPLRG
jgi:hypothetical protein